MTHSFVVTAFALAFSISASAFAGTSVYVEQATGSGASASDLSTATELIRAAVGDVSSDAVTDQPDKADLILRPRLIRLGQAYVLSLTKLRGSEVLFSSELKAERIDELDKVAERLTRSVLTGERAKDTPRVGEITDQEAHDGTQRRPARKAAYLGFGGSSFGNLGSSGIGYSFGLGYGWDLNVIMIKLIAEGDIDGAAFFMDGALGASYFFDTRDFAPYLSADFGGGAAKIDGGGVLSGQTVGGFVVGVGAGVEILRTAAINLDIGFRAAFLLHSNDFGTPAAYSLRLGIYF